jgi:two-component system response regulator (stage 0 sporulation protein F)
MPNCYHVLVVDDQKGVRQLLETFFGEKGFSVTTANNGLEAVNCIMKKVPDLVIMDVKMPIMDGTEALAQIKHNKPCLPVIMMTAYVDVLMQEEFAALGAEACILKPIDLEKLLETVMKALEPK